MKKVTAVIPTIGRMEYLDITLKSLIEQDIPFDEIIVFDNSIEHNIQEVSVYKNHKNIKFIVGPNKQLSAYKSWNKAISLATSEYVTIVGDDDIVDTSYRKEADEIIRTCDIGILKARSIDKNGDLINDLKYPKKIKMSSDEFRHARFLGRTSLFVPGIIFKKTIFLKAIGFKDTHMNGLAYSDDLLLLTMAQIAKSITVSKEICWSYRVHPQQIGKFYDLSNYIDNLMFYIDLFEKELVCHGTHKDNIYIGFSRQRYIEKISKFELAKFTKFCFNNSSFTFFIKSLFSFFIFDNRITPIIKVRILYSLTKIYIKETKLVRYLYNEK